MLRTCLRHDRAEGKKKPRQEAVGSAEDKPPPFPQGRLILRGEAIEGTLPIAHRRRGSGDSWTGGS
jgi:hypothetical protein